MTDREKRIEVAVKNPEQVVETPEEMVERQRLKELYNNSNMGLHRALDSFDAGWIAAKAYYDVHS